MALPAFQSYYKSSSIEKNLHSAMWKLYDINIPKYELFHSDISSHIGFHSSS